jgi:hypothetical protein
VPTSTPVAFLIFNRPDTTARVFEEIRRARPPKLLVVADGPRADRPGEAEKCTASRAIIDRVDWPCEVLKNYSDINLGCKGRVSSGLDWVFKTVEEAIILEDDCLPHHTFFRFCEELLELYRDDERIMMVSGFNIDPRPGSDDSGYFFSKYPHIWGWASWRRAWKHYDVTMARWPGLRDSKEYYRFCGSLNERIFWKTWFDAVYTGKVDTWDAQLTFAFFCRSGLGAFPNINLISNIGFGLDATHTKSDRKHPETGRGIHFPLKHPGIVAPDVVNDNKRRKLEYSKRIVNIFKELIFRLTRMQ